MSSELRLPEAAARRLLLLRAFETVSPEPASWTAADRDWATRVAQASLGDAATPARFVDERARHALERLGGRDAAVRRVLQRRVPFGPAVLAAVLLALALGLAVDQIGPAQRINLLAPPVWALVAWNLAVYVVIALGAAGARAPRGLRAALQRGFAGAVPRAGPLQRFAADWAQVAAPLHGARAAALLHLAAAALAAGVVGGLYARGLVLDYRAGWESTFVDGATVQRLLATLLAPAAAVAGLAVPDAGALRVLPGAAAQGPAAPWLHLYATTLALTVIGPRLLLAALALARVAVLVRRLPLPADDPWLQRLVAQGGGAPLAAWLQPHARPWPAQAALALRDRLATIFGPRTILAVADPLPYGDEDDAARCTPPPGTTLVLLAVDLATTPEAEVHGRWLRTLAAAAPGARRVLLADAAALAARSAHAPERVAERRAAWQRLADEHGAGLAILDDDDAALERACRG